MTFEEFIKIHISEITSAQRTSINWLEDCKKKGLKLYNLKGKRRI